MTTAHAEGVSPLPQHVPGPLAGIRADGITSALPVDVELISETISRVLEYCDGSPGRPVCAHWHRWLAGHLAVLAPIAVEQAPRWGERERTALVEGMAAAVRPVLGRRAFRWPGGSVRPRPGDGSGVPGAARSGPGAAGGRAVTAVARRTGRCKTGDVVTGTTYVEPGNRRREVAAAFTGTVVQVGSGWKGVDADLAFVWARLPSGREVKALIRHISKVP
ncbi:hypothetical protein [Streptomyces venezuelae]|uniref:hypothetical protein n=1 Tax=Streptomyces venezuelae TaxID=54571 RepID=UPI00332950F7